MAGPTRDPTDRIVLVGNGEYCGMVASCQINSDLRDPKFSAILLDGRSCVSGQKWP